MDGNNDVTLRCVQGPFPDFEVLFFFSFFFTKGLDFALASFLWPCSKYNWKFITGKIIKCQRVTVSKFSQACGCISQVNISQEEPCET